MYRKKQDDFIGSFSNIDFENLFVHSDAMKTMPLIKVSPSKDAILTAHIELLQDIAGKEKLLIPTFSYQFPRNRFFDLDKTPSEVGHISEYYRNNVALWRSHDPMFSVCGSGKPHINYSDLQCPFDDNSIFSKLVNDNSYILFYGTDLNRATIIHYVECKANVQYRYWKSFKGILNNKDVESDVELCSHFRPMGKHLDYDWPRLKNDLKKAGIINIHFPSVFGCKAKNITDFWLSKLLDDPLYLLDKESRTWVEPMLETLGRGFLQEDFE
ncbi:AAC(3) family N-acetyltransferase [Vibrio sp. CK2-1]|uniref:AAC(3) family N-acetyltransferase n=1 Tax=Vibrio sp. CK2-1 TaxID=2912249 RepID=UPI001F41F7E4|nr:AAC(3) family N-acetyltransferase [Vibrio sp. CK2-1]MCF7355629.1 AAC(3) family N-acetyltransferase [Vibrio sp. CK2-1]